MVNRIAERHLPALMARIQGLRYAMDRMPAAAAREMLLAVQADWKKQQDPYGDPWKPVVALRAMDREIDSDITRPFDPDRHVMESWAPLVRGGEAVLVSDHRAAGFLKRRHKGRPARRMHPDEGQGLGTWEKRIQRMLRRLIYGGSLTQEQRDTLKQNAVMRRMERHYQRNQRRVAAGLKPLQMRRTRKDRTRVDLLMRGAANGL